METGGWGDGEDFLEGATVELRCEGRCVKRWRIIPGRANSIYKSLHEVTGGVAHS